MNQSIPSLRRRGINIPGALDINLMDAITVAEAMEEFVEAVPPNMPVTDLIEKLHRQHETGYPVIDVDGHLVGVVTMRDVEEALLDFRADKLTVEDICTRNVIVCRPEQTLGAALGQFGARNLGRLPVIDPKSPNRVLGVVTRASIVRAYAEAFSRSEAMTPKLDAIEVLSKNSEMVVQSAHVKANSALANTLVRDAGFPPDSVLGAIRRARETIVPHGSTRILPGDELALLTTEENAAEVQKWLTAKT